MVHTYLINDLYKGKEHRVVDAIHPIIWEAELPKEIRKPILLNAFKILKSIEEKEKKALQELVEVIKSDSDRFDQNMIGILLFDLICAYEIQHLDVFTPDDDEGADIRTEKYQFLKPEAKEVFLKWYEEEGQNL